MCSPLSKHGASFRTARSARARQWSREGLSGRVMTYGLVVVALVASTPLLADEPVADLRSEIGAALALKREGRWEDCLAALRSVVERAQDDTGVAADAQYEIGKCYLEMALPAQAEEALRAVAAAYSGESRAIGLSRVALIDALTFQGKGDAAIAEASALIQDQNEGRADPVHAAWARVKLAGLLRGSGQVDAALAWLDDLDRMALPPEYVAPRLAGSLLRAEITEAQGNQTAAINALENLVTVSSGVRDDTCNWARVRLLGLLVMTDRYDRAVQVCQDVVDAHAQQRASDTQVGWALLWKGRALQFQQRFTEAYEPMQMAAAVTADSDPRLHFDIYMALGELARRHGYAAQSTSAADSAAAFDSGIQYLRAAFDYAVAAHFDEAAIDQARLAAAKLMSVRGQSGLAIAWLREGIEDPASMDDADRALARAIGELLPAAEARVWHAYLIAPWSLPDPTEPIVQRELGVRLAVPSALPLNDLYARQYWLAQLLQAQRRYSAAIDAFTQAVTSAATVEERGRATLGIAATYALRAKYLRSHGASRQAILACAAGLPYAQAATTDLVGIADAGTPAEAHGAMDAAVSVYRSLNMSRYALDLAEHLLARPAIAADASKRAFAEYLRIRALAWNGRFDEAVAAALALDAQYAEQATADIIEIRFASLAHAAAYSALAGDRGTGQALVQSIEARFPRHNPKLVDFARRICAGGTP